MRKRRLALSALLIMCMVVAMALSVMPMSVLAADAAEPALTGTKLTTAHAGQTLAAGEYYVEPGATLTLRGGTGKSGLTVAANSTVTIHIPEGSTLNVYGGNASGTTGAGAGIEVGATSNLKIIGSGTLKAIGGKAASGSNGSNGETARWGDDGYSYIPDSGYGGAGGGGAGAGIGTKGGNGGSSTNWQIAMNGSYYRTVWTDYFMDDNYSGSNGYNGKDGASASACGGIYIQPSVTLDVAGGAEGASGGSGGSAGSRDYESDDNDIRGLAGGAGGGGGGAGKKGASIGTGGGGGGGGGAGGGIGYAWSCWFVGGGGGGGGAGAKGGSGGAWSSDGKIPDHDCSKYDGGKQQSSLSGGTGSASSGGYGGQGAKVKIRKEKDTDSKWQYPYGGNGGRGGNAGSDCVEIKATQTLYTVNINDGESTTVYHASTDAKFLPATLPVQSMFGYTFLGYYAGDTQYYDDNGALIAGAQITADLTISAKFKENEFKYTLVEKDPVNDTSSETQGETTYTNSITLNKPDERENYLFRGWKIKATSGELNNNAYYTYSTAPVARLLMRSSVQSTNQNFIRNGESFLTIGSEKDFDTVTLYNLSAQDGSDILIEETWKYDHFVITFKDFDGKEIYVQSGNSKNTIAVPNIENKSDEYYTYKFAYWKCNIDGKTYTTSQLANLKMDCFLEYENELGDEVYTGITFTAVYEIEYKKELHFVGSLGNSNLDYNDPAFPNGVLILGEGGVDVPVITNFKITKNDGVASLLLIPQYDKDVFTIKEIYINGQKVYYGGVSVDPTADATTTELLEGFKVTVTGNETPEDVLKILLDNNNQSIGIDNSTSETDFFVQIVYEMATAIGGRYEFGFVTNTPTHTDNATHGDRSEAYGTYDPDANNETDAWRFNELKITVNSTAIQVVVRVKGEVTINDQSFVYNGQPIVAADTTDLNAYLQNVLRYTYNGYFKVVGNTTPLTITWYDADGNKLDSAPKDAGTYRVVISAAQTTYYTEAAPVEATVTILPYKIFVDAQDQVFEYIGQNIVITNTPSQGGIFTKDANGALVPVDAFVNSDLAFSGVVLNGSYMEAGIYTGVISGVLSGETKNYEINYSEYAGTLTITKAVNNWIGDITVPGGEYNGQKYDDVTFDAEFGKDKAKVEYLYGFETDAEGNRTEIWKTEAPVNAGTYSVRITIGETNNYSGLEAIVTLVIKKQEIHVGDLTFEADKKIYNGDFQYWSINPDGNKETDDAEVRLVVTDASLLKNIIFVGMMHPEEYINAGTYEILAILQVASPNYTFIETYTEKDENGQDVTKEREVDEWTVPVEVEILKRQINVTMQDQSSIYNGEEPKVQQGKDYVTITPADITEGSAEYEALLAIIARDFFGEAAEGEFYVPAINYNPNAEYYSLDANGGYLRVDLTEELFEANKALAGTGTGLEFYIKITLQQETVTLFKDTGATAGTYALHAILGNNSNYEIVDDESGNFVIKKKTIDLPTLEDATYNGQEQTHSVADTDDFTLTRPTGTNAGVYRVVVSLKDPNNYQWKIDGAQESSDNQELSWYIMPKKITVVIPDIEEHYIYGVTRNEINEDIKLLVYTWDGEKPYDRDQIQVVFTFMVADEILDAGTYGYRSWEITVTGSGKDNYIIDHIGGNLTIDPKQLTDDEIAALIQSAIKYYTGEQISWAVGDFTIDQNWTNIFGITSVDATECKDANGIYDIKNEQFEYHDPINKYFTDVEINLKSTNYTFADNNKTVSVEVRIAKAENSWETRPSVDASNIESIQPHAIPKFGSFTVAYYTDENCTESDSIDVTEMQAGETYYAKFTVEDDRNYSALVAVISFNSEIVKVVIPTVYLENGTIIADATYKKPYIGTAYRFDCADNAKTDSRYTYAATAGIEVTDAGTYTITFTLNNDSGKYQWEDGSTGPVVFTLIITPANLTITPDNIKITYQEDAPAYTLGATGLVNGETLEALLSEELYTKLNQISCEYTNGSNAGTYDIFACNNDETTRTEIDNALRNYEVTFEKGTLTVNALSVGYDDISSSDNMTLQDLINKGPSFVYDSESKEVTVKDLPDELEVVIVYKDKDGNELTDKPENAGKYTVEITIKVKDEADADNYDLPDEIGEITLTINKAQITITVYDKSYEYDGTDRYEQFNNDIAGSIEGFYTVTFVNVPAFDDGSRVTSIVLERAEYVNAGTYADKITAVHSFNSFNVENYDVTLVGGDLIITKATNEWNTPLTSGNNIVYDKNAVVDGTDFRSEAKFGDETVEYKFYLKQTNGTYVEISAPTDAGTYYVQAIVSGTSNYEGLDSGLVELVIGKATIKIDAVTFADNTVYYNGQAHSIFASNYEDLFYVSYDGNQKTNAGDYEVIATFTVKDTTNYVLDGEASKTAILTINKVVVTITADDKTSKYGEPIADLTYTLSFAGNSEFSDFYTGDWGSIVLSTTATDESDVDEYDIDQVTVSNKSNYEVIFNKGTYTITKFTGNTVTVEAGDVRYLMELIYSAEALRGEDTVKFIFADTKDGAYTDTPPKNVGTYYVMATIEGTDNYDGCTSEPVSFTISKATLEAITITSISYNKDTATWSAVGMTTDGMQIDCDVIYQVGEQNLNTPSFIATSAGSFSVIAVPSGETASNYVQSAAVALATVYSVEFKDKVANHERQHDEADLSASAFDTQYLFAGQYATEPTVAPTIVGYTFHAWRLDGSEYNYNFISEPVNENIILYAFWDIKYYTISFYNEVVTGSTVVNGVFIEGTPYAELFKTYSVAYGDRFTLAAVNPTKAESVAYTYTLAGWSETLGGPRIDANFVYVYGDMDLYAVYISAPKKFTITYMVSIDGGAYEPLGDQVTAPYGTQLVSLDIVNWFIGDVWYTDEVRETSAPTFVPAGNMTLYGAYVFDIGAGDVNADGEIDVNDITLYRRWIVGGYDIVSVAPGTEWEIAKSDSFNKNTLYFIERVNDANRDDSGDIRDITTVRMALTGGYGYTYVSGLNSLAGVTGEAVVIESQRLFKVDTTESFKDALELGGSIQLTSDITFGETITIGEDTVIYLNGHELDMSANVSRPFKMASNTRLVIYADNATVKVGNYGLVDIPVGTDNVEVILNGGSYVANTDNGSFIKPRGEGQISIELNNVNLNDSSAQNYAMDTTSYTGNKLSVKITGGAYNVWCGFSLDGLSGNTYLLDGVTINSRYAGITAGGHDDDTFSTEAAAHVTVNNCTINVEADFSKNNYSAEMACIVAGFGAQVEVTNSNLSSNVHIASICSGNGNCTIKLNGCNISAGQGYEQYKFFDNGSIQVDGVEQDQE